MFPRPLGMVLSVGFIPAAWILLFTTSASAENAAVITGDEHRIEIGEACEILPHADPDWTIEDVTSSPIRDGFEPLQGTYSLTQKDGILWARLKIIEKEET